MGISKNGWGKKVEFWELGRFKTLFSAVMIHVFQYLSPKPNICQFTSSNCYAEFFKKSIIARPIDCRRSSVRAKEKNDFFFFLPFLTWLLVDLLHLRGDGERAAPVIIAKCLKDQHRLMISCTDGGNLVGRWVAKRGLWLLCCQWFGKWVSLNSPSLSLAFGIPSWIILLNT